MLLICTPGMQILRTALIAAASLIYFLKNGEKLIEKNQRSACFFKQKGSDEGENKEQVTLTW